MLRSLSSSYFFESFIYAFAILFVIFSLFYNIFGICFLILEKQYESCYLWLYNLLSLISYNIFVILLPKTLFCFILWYFCTIFLFIFGGNQLFYSECSNLNDVEFYIYGTISFILQCLFMFIIPICFFRRKEQRIEESDSIV